MRTSSDGFVEDAPYVAYVPRVTIQA